MANTHHRVYAWHESTHDEECKHWCTNNSHEIQGQLEEPWAKEWSQEGKDNGEETIEHH